MFFTLFIISILTFILIRSIPGSPWDSERQLPARTVAILNETYNLDAPLYKQYTDYMGAIIIPRIVENKRPKKASEKYWIDIPIVGTDKAFRWMNFGPSYASRGRRNVQEIFSQNLPVSAQLGLAAFAIAIILGIPFGVLAALYRNSFIDYLTMGIAIAGVSLPVIISGPILRYLFGVLWQDTPFGLPPTGWGTWKHMIMPAFSLGFASSAILARLTRASLLQVLNEDYIRTAKAKGLRAQSVVIIHALKNSLIPVVTILGPLFAGLVTGSFVAEIVFGIPGMGRFFIDSITNRDYPVVMGTTLLFGTIIIIANLLVDITYAILDPRIRYT